MVNEVPAVPVQATSPEAGAPKKSWVPDRNVLAGGIVGVIVYILQTGADSLGVTIPMSLQPLLPIAVGFVVTYLLPPSAQDVAKRINDGIVKLAARMPASDVSERTVVVPPSATIIPGGSV